MNKEKLKPESKKMTKEEMIIKLEKDIKQLEIAFHQKTGALAILKEID
tara:strand:- start:3576 stop:3719 length:144 start_codon:yes stop_codon:yes gene_type:complete